MIDPEDMTILVAAILSSQRIAWSHKTCIKEAKEFVRFAEKSLARDRALRRHMAEDEHQESNRAAIENAVTALGGSVGSGDTQ